MNFAFCGAKLVILCQILAQTTLKNTLFYFFSQLFSNPLHSARKTAIYCYRFLTPRPAPSSYMVKNTQRHSLKGLLQIITANSQHKDFLRENGCGNEKSIIFAECNQTTLLFLIWTIIPKRYLMTTPTGC